MERKEKLLELANQSRLCLFKLWSEYKKGVKEEEGCCPNSNVVKISKLLKKQKIENDTIGYAYWQLHFECPHQDQSVDEITCGVCTVINNYVPGFTFHDLHDDYCSRAVLVTYKIPLNLINIHSCVENYKDLSNACDSFKSRLLDPWLSKISGSFRRSSFMVSFKEQPPIVEEQNDNPWQMSFTQFSWNLYWNHARKYLKEGDFIFVY